jgi:hypothetical protein
MDINKYRETLYKIKLWVLRGNENRVRLILDTLTNDERNFRALQEISHIVQVGDVDVLKHIFSLSVPDRIKKAREKYPRAYYPWAPEDDTLLKERYRNRGGEVAVDLSTGNYCKWESIEDLARSLQRSPGSICERLVKHLEIVCCDTCQLVITKAERYTRNSIGELIHLKCRDEDEDEAEYCCECGSKIEDGCGVECNDEIFCDDCREADEDEDPPDTLTDWWEVFNRHGGEIGSNDPWNPEGADDTRETI